jgi:hypothetical protein
MTSDDLRALLAIMLLWTAIFATAFLFERFGSVAQIFATALVSIAGFIALCCLSIAGVI